MAEPHTDVSFDNYQEDADEDDQQFKEFLDIFSAKDAILEPGISKTFERFLDLGGSDARGMRALASSYVGMPQTINVLIEWLHAAGFRKREIQAMVEEHLKALILRHFDPKKADLIFTEEGSTPSWLEEMIVYPTWRELFYQLADQYPDCLMLKFTIKLVSDAGYQSEITSASTASHQPEVFSGLVRNAVAQVATAKSTDLDDRVKEFTQLVCHTQHTYLYCEAVLQSLITDTASDPASSSDLRNFQQWLTQEMQREAQKRRHDVTNMSLHFSSAGSHARLFDALASMLSRNALNPADMSVLYKHYASEEEEGNTPPAKYLQIPQLLEMLVQALFKPGSNVNPDHKEKYLYVLAYAVSVHEPRGELPRHDDLQSTKKAIELAHSICSRANDSHAELQVEIPTLFECVRYPIVAHGVLRWVEHTLTDTTFFEEAAESSPLFLVLLDEISACHRLQHPFVLGLLRKLMEESYPMLEVHVQLELKKSLVDHLVQLFSCGHILPVVGYMQRCMLAETLDQSLIRHFVSEVLSIIQPPYSGDFSSVLLPLVQNQEITGPLVSADLSDPVSIFLAECSRKTKKKKKAK